MATGVIHGTRVLGEPGNGGERGGDKKPCPRCGYLRRTSNSANRTGLCKDCSSGMTPEERRLWKD